MTPPPERRAGWSGPLADKRGPSIRPLDRLVDLGAWWLTLALLAAGTVMVVLHEVRPAVMLLAAGAALGAFLRAVLPERLAGGLVTRSRWADVLMWLLMSGLLWMMARLIRL